MKNDEKQKITIDKKKEKTNDNLNSLKLKIVNGIFMLNVVPKNYGRRLWSALKIENL